MYRYDEFDRDFVKARTVQFRDKVERRLRGELTEEEFKPLGFRTGCICSFMHTCCGSPSPMACCQARRCAGLPESPGTLIADTVISRRARTSSSAGSNSSRHPTYSTVWRNSTCMPSDVRKLHPQCHL